MAANRRLWCSLLGLLAALALLGVASGAVIGIDFGAELVKVAAVRPGTPFHIVTDEGSNRKVPALVGFDDKERAFGTAAQTLAVRRPHMVIQNIKAALGYDSDEVNFAPDINTWHSEGSADGRLRVAIPWAAGAAAATETSDDGTPTPLSFTAEEATAMLLEYIKSLAIADADGLPVTDCVITVPSYWTQAQRQALLDAAAIAGLNVLTLLNENTAFAVQYGLDRDYGPETPEHLVAFYNMGTQNTEVSVVRYSSVAAPQKGLSRGANRTVGQLSVEGLGWEEDLGGFAFDSVLADFMLQKFVEKHGGDEATLRQSPRTMAKILSQANRVKKILSANTETPVNVQSLYMDLDLQAFVTRAQFNSMAQPLLERVSRPLEQALKDAGIELHQLDAIVFVGGCSRIPAVQQEVKHFTTLEDGSSVRVASNIDRDEGGALGAVFVAANHSTAFQVRRFGMVDRIPHALSVQLSEEQEESSAEDGSGFHKSAPGLFDSRSTLGRRKTISFQHDRNFQATVSHLQAEASEVESTTTANDDFQLPMGSGRVVAVQRVTGLSEAVAVDPFKRIMAANGTKPKVTASFALDSNGVVRLVEAKATMEEMVRVEVPQKPAPKSQEEAPADGEESKPASDAVEGDDTASAAEDEGPESQETSADAAEETEEEQPEPEPVEYQWVKKTRKVKLAVSSVSVPIPSHQPLSGQDISTSKHRLGLLSEIDRHQRELAEARNTLESTVYNSRANLWDDWEPVSTEEEREILRTLLEETEEWLYDVEDDASVAVFTGKLAEVKRAIADIQTRAKEVEARPLAVAAARELLQYGRGLLKSWPKEKPWLAEADRASVQELLEDLQTWLDQAEADQADKELFESPAFLSSEVYARMRPAARRIEVLNKTPKPKPPKVEKSKKAKKQKRKNEQAETSDEAEEEAPTTQEAEDATDATWEYDDAEPMQEQQAEPEAAADRSESHDHPHEEL